MLRALLVNVILITTAALLGMGLLSGKLRNRCFSIADGVPEHSFSVHRTCDRGRAGPLSGRSCPGGFACLALGEFSVWSFDSASWAVLCVTRLMFLCRWSELYTHVSDAVGALGSAYVLVAVLGGGLVTLNIFVPLLVIQLEKLRNRSYIETGKRMIRRWIKGRWRTILLDASPQIIPKIEFHMRIILSLFIEL
jgi:hypothetical protein